LSGVGAFASSRGHAHGAGEAEAVIDSQDTSLTLEELCSDLRNAISNVSGHDGNLPKFLPIDMLRKIISNDVIAILLQDLPNLSQEEIEHLQKEVTGSDTRERSMRRVFAILIWIGKPETITVFVKEDVRDVDLPLRIGWRNETRSYEFRRRKDKNGSNGRVLKPLRKLWTSNHVEEFDGKQFIVTIPFFNLGDYRPTFYHLNYNNLILPFIQKSIPVAGGNGAVSRVKIHPAQHNYRNRVWLSLSVLVRSIDFRTWLMRAADIAPLASEQC
jgi:hypothetical protein